MKKITLYIFLAIILSIKLNAQEIQSDNTLNVSKMSREQVLELSYDQLLDLPFDQVLELAKIVGVSMDELYEMLLNKNVTSASKKAESSFNSPLSTTVISYDEIIQSGARNIQEVLRLVPGVIVREKTNGNYDIHIRGNDNLPDNNLSVYSENSLTLVMINNRPVYNYVNGGTFWESLPVDISDLDRIEVVRGPASALYGANAVSGVINIITKTPDSKKVKVNGQVQGGNLGSYMGSLSVGQNMGKLGYRVSGNYQKMDRTTDKLYVFADSSYVTKEELATKMNPKMPWLSIFDPGDDVDEWYPDPKTACDRYGANAFLYYNLKKDINFSLAGGYQNSYVNSSSFGDPPVSVNGREMSSSYVDFVAKVKGLSLQVNTMFGMQDIARGDTGFKVDNKSLNAMLEYDLNLGKLNIRPGIAYQQASYDDTPYLTPNSDGNYTDGFLNQERELNSFAGSLRADYKMLNDKLRLIAALRFEKYNVNDDYYFPFQFIGSYTINDKNLFRIVYSRANRSPFLVDAYSNYDWIRTGRPYPLEMKFNGNTDQKLAQMNMVELGYRYRPLKNLLVDLEAFYSKTKDFGCLLPDSLTVLVSTVDSVYNSYYGTNLPVPAKALPAYVNLTYRNIDLESHQTGVTLNIEWVASQKLVVKAFGTVQHTELKNYTGYNNSEIITKMTTEAATTFATDYASFKTNYASTGVPDYFIFSNLISLGAKNTFFTGAGYDTIPSALVYTTNTNFYNKTNKKNKATPSFYGGFSINYSPISKLNAFVNGYYYSKQEFTNSNGTFKIDPKITFNCKISYKVWKETAVFVNARNMFNASKQEFAWTDETKGVYLVGLDLKF